VPFKLGYCEVVGTLVRVIFTVYNKLAEINCTKGTSFKQLVSLLKRMDEHFMSKVITPIVEDLNRVARCKA
jgi:hypothetical protein